MAASMSHKLSRNLSRNCLLTLSLALAAGVLPQSACKPKGKKQGVPASGQEAEASQSKSDMSAVLATIDGHEIRVQETVKALIDSQP